MYRFGNGLSILQVEDHDVVREGLGLLLASYPDVVRLEQAGNGAEGLALLKANPLGYQLLVTDMQMPLMDGLTLITKARLLNPELRIVALTVDGSVATVAEALEAGAQSYLLKNSGKELLFKAITEVLAGKTFVDQALSGELIDYMRSANKPQDMGLSPRELEVLRCIGQELTNEQIADRLFISERTVETHRKNIFRKTGTKNLVGLVQYAKQEKII
jgi:DNA-binding NarL/FixJ family response regulator